MTMNIKRTIIALSLFVAAFSAIAESKNDAKVETIVVNGENIYYGVHPTQKQFAVFGFERQEFYNAYLLDCSTKNFIWADQRITATRKETHAEEGAEWKPVTSESKRANAVYNAICPRILKSLGTNNKKPTDEYNKISYEKTDDGNRIVIFHGEIEEGDADRIKSAIKTYNANILYLSSEGGILSEAKEVGYYVKANNIHTMTVDYCASACIYILAAGNHRLVGNKALVGVHRAALSQGSFESGQQSLGDSYTYFKTMGVNPEIAIIASGVSSENITWLDQSKLVELNLATDILDIAK